MQRRIAIRGVRGSQCVVTESRDHHDSYTNERHRRSSDVNKHRPDDDETRLFSVFPHNATVHIVDNDNLQGPDFICTSDVIAKSCLFKAGVGFN